MGTVFGISLQRKVLVGLVLVNLLAALVVAAVHVAAIFYLRSSQAKVFVMEQRNALLAGERRGFFAASEKYRGDSFSHIALAVDGLHIPSGFMQGLTGKLVVPIYFDEGEKELFGAVTFRYRPGAHSDFAIAAWLTFLFASLPLAWIFQQWTIRDQERLLVLKRKEAIATSMQMLAHDLRKPFQMMQSLLSILSKANSVGETRTLITRFAPDVTRAMSNLEGLLHQEVVDEPAPRLKRTPVQVEDLFREALAANLSLRWRHDITLDLASDRDLWVDRPQMMRAFMNIVANALEAMPKGGKLWCHTSDVINHDEPFVKVELGNSGAYIPRSLRRRIFEPFFTHGKKRGSGLGLAIVREIVEAHGGTITVRSKKGWGTVFEMLIPAWVSSFSATNANIPTKSDTESAKALVLDDCPLSRYQWQNLLGDGVATFENPGEFFTAVESGTEILSRFACAVVDYYFEGDGSINGRQVAQKLRAQGFGQPIFISSHSVDIKEDSLYEVVPKEPAAAWKIIRKRLGEDVPPVYPSPETLIPSTTR